MQAERASLYLSPALLSCLLWSVGCSLPAMARMEMVNQTTGTLQMCIGPTPWPQCTPWGELPPASVEATTFRYAGDVWLFWVDYDSEFKSILKDGVTIADARGRQRHIPLAEILKRRECLGTGSPCHYWRIRLDSSDLPP